MEKIRYPQTPRTFNFEINWNRVSDFSESIDQALKVTETKPKRGGGLQILRRRRFLPANRLLLHPLAVLDSPRFSVDLESL